MTEFFDNVNFLIKFVIFKGQQVTLQFIFFDGEEAFRDWNSRVKK